MSAAAPDSWTVLRVLEWTAERFGRAALDSPRLDAEVLLAHCLGVARIQLYVDFAKPLGPQELSTFRALVRRRLAHEPVAYIVGQREFWSLPLFVDPSVLVPRPESELLVEVALAHLNDQRGDGASVVDVGTGSGAVAIAIAQERPAALVSAIDISAAALAVARKNAAMHAVTVTFHEGDLLAALPEAAGPVDVIVSNPPYIPTAELAGLPTDVKDWEPAGALDGGTDGLDLVRRLVAAAAARMAPAGLIALEIHPPLRAEVERLLVAHGFVAPRAHADLAGHDRVVSATRAEA